MKVRLLKKVRRAAWRICAYEFFGWTSTNGRMTGFSCCAGYEWAFDWMLGEKLDPERAQAKIVFKVARLLWAKELRAKWGKKLGRNTTPVQKGGAR